MEIKVVSPKRWIFTIIVLLILGVVLLLVSNKMSLRESQLLMIEATEAAPSLIDTQVLPTSTLTPISTPVLATRVVPTIIIPAPMIESCDFDSTYVADITVPDNAFIQPETIFTKTWRVRNSGNCNWPIDTNLVFVRGDQLSGPDKVGVSILEVGQEGNVSVVMATPGIDGNFRGVWQLSSNGEPFGTYLTVVVRIGRESPAAIQQRATVFELGGQTHDLSHPAEMHHSGMTWVKFQVKWSPGMTGDNVHWRINLAHSQGFKVLLSISGAEEYPSSIDLDAYVEFLGQVAERGPNAIEIWNEQNIDREWPAGQIDPKLYVQKMLIPGYRAIKGANPSVIVISGAPAPTGFFGACGPNGCDDLPYIQGMAGAGAIGHMDCVGLHYNEGVIPPSWISGDPRKSSSHYTHYFSGMAETYWGIFGLPLCFTELGYLSPEGYPPIDPGGGFPWAANTSVAQQSQWLAEAVYLAGTSNRVRLLVVWNVDIFHYHPTFDPQGGYAIIRPDGSCPACQALHEIVSN